MYPSDKDFKWIVQSNLIKNCLVGEQDVAVAHMTRGKDINYLKAKTTRRNQCRWQKDFVEAPDKMLKLHKYGYLTADMLLSRMICFFNGGTLGTHEDRGHPQSL